MSSVKFILNYETSKGIKGTVQEFHTCMYSAQQGALHAATGLLKNDPDVVLGDTFFQEIPNTVEVAGTPIATTQSYIDIAEGQVVS